MSARLSPQAVVHLILATKTRSVLVSPQLDSLAAEATTLFEANREVAWVPSFRQAPSFALFVHAAGGIDTKLAPSANRIVDPRDRNVVILHSSGTTGLPKPIYHTHAYLLGYAACHKLSERDIEGAVNVSTLPLFHVSVSQYAFRSGDNVVFRVSDYSHQRFLFPLDCRSQFPQLPPSLPEPPHTRSSSPQARLHF